MELSEVYQTLFQRTKTPTSYYTKANAQLQFSSAITICELAVHLLIFEKYQSCVCTTVTLSHRFRAFARLCAGVLRAKPVSAGAAESFCKVNSGRALNRPRSPEVRKPLVCFLVLFAQRKKHEKRPLCRKLRGFANLEPAHRSDSFAPQQLKPFKRASRYCKPRISTPKPQIRTNKMKAFRRLGVTFLVAAATSLTLRGRKCVNAYCRTCPFPRTIYFVVVKATSPIGPRTCSFCVDMPISAPKPNSSPSVNRVDALT